MSYSDTSKVQLDISSSGRGLQQTLLLLAHLTVNPGSILLLDEPDAHLEILRQRQIYQIITESAIEQGSQIIAASHSEVILNEAADRDVVVAFVGNPHRIDDRGSQLRKSLKDIGFEDYYQAEQTGWVLYLEGSTDLAILRSLAGIIGHNAKTYLEKPFVHYVQNLPKRAQDHFCGLREAKKDLWGFALFDHLDQVLEEKPMLKEYMWNRREIENYVCSKDTLIAYAAGLSKEIYNTGPLFDQSESQRLITIMSNCIEDLVPRIALSNPSDMWWKDTKVSEVFLDRLFESFFKKLDLPNLMRKTHYHILARYIKKEQIDPEVRIVLDFIVETALHSNPLKEQI
jgi:hypothetical protein